MLSDKDTNIAIFINFVRHAVPETIEGPVKFRLMFFSLGYKTKFDSIVRAIAAIGIGLVMIFGKDAPKLVVQIIAGLLITAGVASLVYGLVKSKEEGMMYRLLLINAGLDIALGLLLLLNPLWIAGVIVYLIGLVLIILGALQLIVLAGTLTLLGAGFSSLILSICAVVGGAFLLFNPFAIDVMSIIAGLFMVLYGVSELVSTWKINRAKKEYEIKYTSAPSQPSSSQPGQIDVSGIADAKEVDFERIDDPDDLDGLDS